MTHSNKLGFAILLSALLVSPYGFASSCYEESPNLTSLGDAYYDLDKIASLTPGDTKKINSLLKKVVGNWKGKGSVFECMGSELNPVPENKKLTVAAKISTNSSNELHIETDKFLVAEKIRLNDHLFYFGDVNNYQSVSVTANKIVIEERFRKRIKKQKPNSETSEVDKKEAPDSEADKAVRDGITFLFKMLHSAVVGGEVSETKTEEPESEENISSEKIYTPFYELIHTIESTQTRFTYRLSMYINGRLAIEERWRLVRN